MRPRGPGMAESERAFQTGDCQFQAQRPPAELLSRGNPEFASGYCPRCSARLEQRSCKMICPACGYYMSCADFYCEDPHRFGFEVRDCEFWCETGAVAISVSFGFKNTLRDFEEARTWP